MHAIDRALSLIRLALRAVLCGNYCFHRTFCCSRDSGESVFDVATPKVKKALAGMQAVGDDHVDDTGDDDVQDDSFLDPAHKK